MIYRLNLQRLLYFRSQTQKVAHNFLYSVEIKRNFKRRSTYFHTLSVHYAVNKKTKEQLQIDTSLKKLAKVHNVWENMTIADLVEVLKCDKEIIKIILPDLASYSPDEELKKHQIFTVAKKLKKKCVIIKNPKVIKNETSQKKEDVIPSRPENLRKRPPVVAIMGHVDHGKTTLLDSLRNSFIVNQEFGGITQHIGAFSVEVKPGETITFVDTPGHAAFTTMRSRGAEITDLVVLVIAADDGIMEQTIESIKIANRAKVKMIVAVNKIDKPKAISIDLIKEKLLQYGIQVEDKGGDVQVVPISALKKINLDLLTDMILLEAELMGLKADPTGQVRGVVVEAKKNEKGILATVIVKKGTLTKRKILVAGTSHARVRSMVNENGIECEKALPSIPVQISGWKSLPAAGDEVYEVDSDKQAERAIREKLQLEMLEKQKKSQEAIDEKVNTHRKEHLENRLFMKSLTDRDERRKYAYEKRLEFDSKQAQKDTKPTLNIIVKGDVHGSVEVLSEILESYDQNDECQLSVVDASVGNVTQTDIQLAQTFNAIIYGFNVDIHENIENYIKDKKVDFRSFNVIYEFVHDLVNELSSRIPLLPTDKIIGEAEVNQNFLVSVGKKKMPVAGCRCVKGELLKNELYRVYRGSDLIYEGKLISMKHFKNEVTNIQKSRDCGLMFEDFQGEFKPSDRIVCYTIVEVPQTTSWNPGF